MNVTLTQIMESYARNVDDACSAELSLHSLPQCIVDIEEWIDLAELELATTDHTDSYALQQAQEFLQNAMTPFAKQEMEDAIKTLGVDYLKDTAVQQKVALMAFALGKVDPEDTIKAQAGEQEALKVIGSSISYISASNDSQTQETNEPELSVVDSFKLNR